MEYIWLHDDVYAKPERQPLISFYYSSSYVIV